MEMQLVPSLRNSACLRILFLLLLLLQGAAEKASGLGLKISQTFQGLRSGCRSLQQTGAQVKMCVDGRKSRSQEIEARNLHPAQSGEPNVPAFGAFVLSPCKSWPNEALTLKGDSNSSVTVGVSGSPRARRSRRAFSSLTTCNRISRRTQSNNPKPKRPNPIPQTRTSDHPP